MRFNLFDPITFFDADKGGAGSSAPASTADPTGGEKPGNNGSQPQTGQPSAQAPAGDEFLKLTSAQLAERLERARAATLKQFGFDDPDALKKALEDGKKALDAQKTDAERKAEEDKQLQERLKSLETQAGQLAAQAEQATLQVEALGLMAGRFANPKAALRLLDLNGVKKGESGYTGLKEAIEKLAADEPWTLAKPALKPVAPAIGPTNPEGDGKQAITDEERMHRYFAAFGSGQEFFAPKKQT